MVVIHLTRIVEDSCECGTDPLNPEKGSNFLDICLITSTFLALYSVKLVVGAIIPLRD